MTKDCSGIRSILILHFISFFFLISCIQELDVFFDSSPVLAVEGLVTDEPGTTYVKVLFTTAYNQRADLSEIEAGSVILYDNDNNTYDLRHSGNGIFVVNEDFCGVVGKSYWLEITLGEGKVYRSAPETMIAVPEIEQTSIRREFEEDLSGNDQVVNRDRIIFSASFQDPENQENYYRWRYRSTYQVLAPLFDEYIAPPPNPWQEPIEPTRDCWATDFDHEYLKIARDELFDGELVDRYDLFSIDVDFKVDIGYYSLIKQYSLTKEAFEFWSKIENQEGNNGTIFETSNYQIRGNVYNIADQEELVLGYFGASSVSLKSAFVSNSFISDVFDYSFCYPGEEASAPNPPKRCLDCRFHSPSSTIKKPDFWPIQ